MLDLAPYRAVSSMPPVRRDLSIVVDLATTADELGGPRAGIARRRGAGHRGRRGIAETAYAELPPAARARLRLRPDQKNVLLRVVLRDLSRTLTHEEANAIRDAVYAAVHEGT